MTLTAWLAAQDATPSPDQLRALTATWELLSGHSDLDLPRTTALRAILSPFISLHEVSLHVREERVHAASLLFPASNVRTQFERYSAASDLRRLSAAKITGLVSLMGIYVVAELTQLTEDDIAEYLAVDFLFPGEVSF